MKGRSGWKEATLEELVFFQRGYDITKSQQKSGVVPVISSSGVSSFHDEAMAPGPGVVVGRKGTIGSIHLSQIDYWPHDTTLWSRNLKGNDARFVYYYLHTIDLKRFDVGNSNPTINRNHIHKIPVRIPPHEVQSEIADRLSLFDKLIENNRRRIALLEESARLLYREWFVHQRFPGHEHVKVVDGVPEGWVWKTIADVSETIGGGTPSTEVHEYWEGGDITWFSPTDLTANDCLALLGSRKKITASGLKNSSAKMLPPETILMSSRATIGYFGMYDGPACTNQGFISMVPHDVSYLYYLLYNLSHRKQEIISLAGGATYKEINKSTFRAFPVVWPCSLLAREFSRFCGEIMEQVRALKRQNEKLREARDLLLPRLMSGEIQV